MAGLLDLSIDVSFFFFENFVRTFFDAAFCLIWRIFSHSDKNLFNGALHYLIKAVDLLFNDIMFLPHSALNNNSSEFKAF